MKPHVTDWKWPLLGAALLTQLSCQVKEDKEYQNLLSTDPRILAIRSEPADIPLGGSGRLSALVYHPDTAAGCLDPTPSYRWSWCPLRGGAGEEFECLLSEADAQAMWEQLGTGEDLPPYELGEAARVDYPNVFGDFAVAVCEEEVSGSDETAQLDFYNCVESLQVSVRVDVEWCGIKRIAIKSLSLLGEDETEDEDFVPNENPDPRGVLTFSPEGKPQIDLTGDDPLEAGITYSASIELDSGGNCGDEDPPEDCAAQTFTPQPIPGISDSEPRRETLVMSWFLTKGNTSPQTLDDEDYQPDTDSNGGQNTFYIEGDAEIGAMLGNIISMEDEGPGSGELFVILRDERGGVGWARYPFTVEESN